MDQHTPLGVCQHCQGPLSDCLLGCAYAEQLRALAASPTGPRIAVGDIWALRAEPGEAPVLPPLVDQPPDSGLPPAVAASLGGRVQEALAADRARREAAQAHQPARPGLWEAKANPSSPGFGPLDLDDPELQAKARAALAAEQARRDAERGRPRGNMGPASEVERLRAEVERLTNLYEHCDDVTTRDARSRAERAEAALARVTEAARAYLAAAVPGDLPADQLGDWVEVEDQARRALAAALEGTSPDRVRPAAEALCRAMTTWRTAKPNTGDASRAMIAMLECHSALRDALEESGGG